MVGVNFTGIDSPYEPPESPEIVVATSQASAEESAQRVVNSLRERGIIVEAFPLSGL